MEFVPRVNSQDDEETLAVHAQSLQNITSSIEAITDASSFEDSLETIPPSVLHPLKQFLGVLANHGAELRIAFPDRTAFSVSTDAVANAFDRLSREVTQDTLTFEGVFRGLTWESGMFDLKLESGEVITGQVSGELTESDLERLSELQNESCSAEIQVTRMRRLAKLDTTS